jgi:hypothetical protein
MSKDKPYDPEYDLSGRTIDLVEGFNPTSEKSAEDGTVSKSVVGFGAGTGNSVVGVGAGTDITGVGKGTGKSAAGFGKNAGASVDGYANSVMDTSSISESNYSTSYCQPRTTDTYFSKMYRSMISNLTGSTSGGTKGEVNTTYILYAYAALGTLFIIVCLWYLLQYKHLLQPFSSGIFRILVCLFIYFLIFSLFALFLKFMVFFVYCVKLTIYYFNLMMNPLLNDTLNSCTCYFSDYISWIFYYPARVFYLICFILVIMFDTLVLIPVIIAFGFCIGYLFQSLGDRDTNYDSFMGKFGAMKQGFTKFGKK